MPTEDEIKVAAEKAATEKATAELEAVRKKAEDEAAAKNATFEAWLEKQPAEVKALYAEHTTGLKSALEKERAANKANADNLKKLAALEAEEEKRKLAQLSETEKLQKAKTDAEAERDRALTELSVTRIKSAVTSEAMRLFFADVEDAYNLANISEIKIGEDGKVTGAKEALEALAKAKPYLLKTESERIGTPRDSKGQKRAPSPQNQTAEAPIPRL